MSYVDATAASLRRAGRARRDAANALLEQGVDTLGVIVDSSNTVVQTAEKRGAYAVGFHYIGAQKFAPKGWITRFARQVMDGTFKSENILGTLNDDFLTLAPFGPAVPAEAVKLVEAKRRDLVSGTLHPFQGPLKDNRGVERVKAGEAFPRARAAAAPSSRPSRRCRPAP